MITSLILTMFRWDNDGKKQKMQDGYGIREILRFDKDYCRIFAREERSYDWPAYWNMDDCHKNVKFKRYYTLEKATSFVVHANRDQAMIEVNGEKFPFGKKILCEPGKIKSGCLSATQLACRLLISKVK